MRWFLLFLALVAFVLAFTRHSGGAFGWWLCIGVVAALSTAVAFTQARFGATARDETLSAYELKQLREGKPIERG